MTHQKLRATDEEVEELVTELILDEKLNGRIDQTTGQLRLIKGYSSSSLNCVNS